MRAAVTRLTPETYPAPEPENKTEEKKEDAQLEIPSYSTAGEHLRVGLPCHWHLPGTPDTSCRLDGGIDHKKNLEKN